MHLRWTHAVVLLVVAVVLLLPTRLWSQLVGASFDAQLQADLAAATTVLQGVVVADTPSRHPTTSVITSEVTIRRTAVLKGVHSPDTRTLTIDGGTVGDLTYNVEDISQLSTGDRLVVLLDADYNPMPGRYLYKLGKTDDAVVDAPNLTLGDIRRMLQ